MKRKLENYEYYGSLDDVERTKRPAEEVRNELIFDLGKSIDSLVEATERQNEILASITEKQDGLIIAVEAVVREMKFRD